MKISLKLFGLQLIVLLLSICFGDLNAARKDTEELKTLINEAVDRRDTDNALFQRALASNDLSLQKSALLGLGRIGDPSTTKLIGTSLYSPQPEIRQTAAFALAISNDANAYAWVARRLANETNNEVKAELISAIGLLPKQEADQDKIALILPYLDDKSLSVRKAACDGLNYAWSMYRDSISVPNSTQAFKLMALAQENSELADHCLYALTRIRTEVALFEEIQLQKTITSAKSDNHHKLLLLIVTEQADAYADYVVQQLNNNTDAGVLAQAATALAKLNHDSQLNDAYELVLNHPASQVKIGFIQGLASAPPSDQSIQWLKRLSKDKSDWIKYRSLTMLFQAEPENYLTPWLAVFENNNAAYVTWEAMIMQIVAEMDSAPAKSILERALKSSHEAIRDYAQTIVSEEESDDSRLDSKTVDYAKAASVFGKLLTVKTSRGEMTLQLLSAAPYTALNFYNLATAGYYDGIIFHRVIPNFVAQGGDPTGTGSGGPGYSIREELSFARHQRGTVGMATAGKDTGGSQFFFNLKANWHLDKRYTVFARVTNGLEIMDNLERGDTIISIKEN